jgi:hypothetical protein
MFSDPFVSLRLALPGHHGADLSMEEMFLAWDGLMLDISYSE